VREHVAGQLRDLGYQVSEVPDAAQALALLRRDRSFALLFTDVIMPGGMNGLDLAALARRMQPGLRVLLTSGYNEPLIVRPEAEAEALPMLGKPYRRQALAAKLRTVLDGEG
jgi:CheY-like chemotaxis protein